MVIQALYELDNVSYGIAGSKALDGLTADINQGGCVGLLGCNGAGKSTLLYLLAGLINPIAGQIKWNGDLISADILRKNTILRTDFRSKIGIVFQDSDAQFLSDNVRDEIAYGPRQLWNPSEADDYVADAIQVMGLNHLVNQAPYALSGGEKRRVALASVIAMDPDVLLLDEPTASLDAATSDFLLDWLENFIRREEKTVIMATHDLALLTDLADRCFVLTPCHRLAVSGSVTDIMADEELLRQMNLVGRRKSTKLHIDR